MYHTGVPGELQGKGIAKILAQVFDKILILYESYYETT